MANALERDLLLGLLAVRDEVITPEEFIAALRTRLTDASETLASVLVAQAKMDSEDATRLASLAAKHSAGPARALAALLSDAEFLQLVQQSDHESTLCEVINELSSLTHAPRFDNLREYAKGGVGEVFVAHDNELNREVALKEIQAKYVNRSESRLRFRREAEITGCLEHPGVVPVYASGQHADGRPYYAMRLIRGENLRDAIERFYSQDATAHATSQRHLEMRELLRHVINACQAVAYAHSRGVIHRDLKPENIMLGKYGETLVVDWGVAMAKGRDETARRIAPDEQTVLPGHDSNVPSTQEGARLGTRFYMPPEQARGELERVGVQSDVYALGATLFHVLTGQHPFAGVAKCKVYQEVCAGSFVHPRIVRPQTPGALEAICLKAMALQPKERYVSPADLAQDIERYLAGESVSVHLESLWERIERVRRKNPLASKIAGSAFILLVLVMAVALIVVCKKNQRLEALSTSESAARSAAQAGERQAREQSGELLSTLATVIDEIQQDLKHLPRSSSVRRRLLAMSLARLNKLAGEYINSATVDRETLRAAVELAEIIISCGAGDSTTIASIRKANLYALTPTEATRRPAELARALLVRAIEIGERLAEEGASDVETLRYYALALRRLGDVHALLGSRQEAREIGLKAYVYVDGLCTRYPEDIQLRRDVAMTLSALGRSTLTDGPVEVAVVHFDAAVALIRGLATDNPGEPALHRDLAALLVEAGRAHLILGNFSVATKNFADAGVLCASALARDPLDNDSKMTLVDADLSQGDVRIQEGDLDTAMQFYASAHSRCAAIREFDSETIAPKYLEADCLLAVASGALDQGQPYLAWERAAAAYEIALSLEEVGSFDLLAASLHVQCALVLGYTSLELGDLDSAEEYFDEAHKFALRLDSDARDHPSVQRLLAWTSAAIGDIDVARGEAAEALEQYEHSRSIIANAASENPKDLGLAIELASLFAGMGDLLADEADPKDAFERYNDALQCLGQLGPDALSTYSLQSLRSDIYSGLAEYYLAAGDGHAAFESASVAHECAMRMAEMRPSRTAEEAIARTLRELGRASLATQDLVGARSCLERSETICTRIADEAPDDADAQISAAATTEAVAQSLYALGDYEASCEAYTRLVERWGLIVRRRQSTPYSYNNLIDAEGLQQKAVTLCQAMGDFASILGRDQVVAAALLDVRGAELIARGRYDEAQLAASELQRYAVANASQRYNAASVLALCAAAISSADDAPISADQSERRQTLLDSAIIALRAARDVEFADVDRMRTDPNLAALRDLPEFQRLLTSEDVLPPAFAP